VERLSELESWRRSLALADPRSPTLDREEAMRMLSELQDVERRLRDLRAGVKKLLADET